MRPDRSESLSPLLICDGLDRGRKFVHDESMEVYLGACVIDIDSSQVALGVVIEDHALGDFTTLDAGMFRQVDVQRISLGIVVEFHGLNRRSGKALWIVTLSSSVMTLR